MGGFVCPPEWFVLGLYPPVWAGVAMVVVRCVVWPIPSLFETWRSRVATWSGLTRTVVAVALITRVVVLGVGLAASFVDPNRLAPAPRISENPVVTLPARWDAFWYLDIARYGYHWNAGHDDEQQDIAFFPGYPLAMRVAGDIVTIPAYLLNLPNLLGGGDGRVIWGGVAASWLFFVLALSRIHRLAWQDTRDASAAARSCILLASYPFAIFFTAPYSESLALFALASLVLAWRRDDARAGTVWGLLFGLCRSNGWCVAFALAADWIAGRSRGSKRRRAAMWMAIAAAPLGAVLYSVYIYHLTGHPLAWAAAQHAWGGRLQPLNFVTRRWDAVQLRGLRGYYHHDPVDAWSFVAAAVMTTAAVVLLVRRQWLYGVLVVAYLAPAIAIDLPATGRMTALLFPAFILLGKRFRGAAFVALAAVFTVGQIWFAWRFFLWRTPY